VSDRVKQASRSLSGVKFIVLGVLAAGSYALYQHPPVQTIGRQEIGIRSNRLTGSTTQLGEGAAVVLPGLHDLRLFSLQDQTYRPTRSSKADGEAPFQSSEGLSIGVELSIRYALEPAKLTAVSANLPDDINGDLVEPLVQGVIYKVFTRYTVREIFSTKRQELHDVIEADLKPLLANEGIRLRSVMMGNIDLPADYRAGMDRLLAVELETEQMQYTLQLKEKQVKESELQGEAEKVKREKAAEATANEQIIAAKAQEEAMKHVLPFKQKQIEQRKLEAEADKSSRIRMAEGTAEARRIEAAGEADSRRKLSDADVYRMEQLGKVASTQLERDGALITRHPLLIQKTLADKLSDKISVIIAPPPADGGFIGSTLLGGAQSQRVAQDTSGTAGGSP
jgi:regulator of protease activity HflC (stomatin/prohibitin superfamily)